MFRKLSASISASMAAAFLSVAVLSATVTSDAFAQSTAASEAAPAASETVSATPTAPAPAPAASVAKEDDNPYSLINTVKNGHAVDKMVLALLLIMSVGSWYITIVKAVEQNKVLRQAKEAEANFWNAGSVRQGADLLDESSAFRYIAEAGIDATKEHSGMLAHIDLNTWVTMNIGRAQEKVQSRLQDGLAFLATTGSVSPFIGLFGTVWGILNALTAIGRAGQASIDKVAGPVGAALIMTAIGLAVAVPAVLGYNWLVRRNKTVMEAVRAFSSDLHSVLLASANKKA